MGTIYDSQTFFDQYSKMARSRQGLAGAGEWRQLEPLFPELRGKSVLDLGCGYGWHCKYAADQGAETVLGLDASERMIAEARARNAHPRVRYEVQALDEYSYPGEAYDLVICNLVLHYVENLENAYRNVHRTLRPGGVFLFNIEHPVFTAGVNEEWVTGEDGEPLYWPVDRYFFPGQRETVFLGQKVKKQHHTLTQILGGLLKTGFLLEAVEEAQPPADMLDIPGMADELRRPMMLLVRAKK